FASNDVGSKGVGDGLPSGVSHGGLVFRELVDQLNGERALAAGSSPEPATRYVDADWMYKDAYSWRYGNQKLVLLGVDTDAYATSDVLMHLTTLVEQKGFKRLALNLSFVVAPCDRDAKLADLTPDRDAQIAAYRQLISRSKELAGLKDKLDSLESEGK